MNKSINFVGIHLLHVNSNTYRSLSYSTLLLQLLYAVRHHTSITPKRALAPAYRSLQFTTLQKKYFV